MEIRFMSTDELEKIRDIDRSETIRVGYRQEGRKIVAMDAIWDDDGWSEGDGEHSFGQIIRSAKHYLKLNGTAIGAFDGAQLVGIAVYRPSLTEAMGQLGLLHVSNGYRRRGIATALFREVLALARRDGTPHVYVSATPSESAVGFYLDNGFEPTDTPVPELHAEEPDDIHMVLEL